MMDPDFGLMSLCYMVGEVYPSICNHHLSVCLEAGAPLPQHLAN